MVVSLLANLNDAAQFGRADTTRGRQDALAAVAEVLNALVPADGGGWIELDTDSSRSFVRSFHHEAASDTDIADGVVATAADHPMVRSFVADRGAHDRSARRLSDLVTINELRRTRAYAVLLKPLAIEHQLFVVTGRSSRSGARGWAFNRSRLDFSEREVEQLSSIQPLLAIIDRSLEHAVSRSHAVARWGLSDREVEILGHVAAGLTADAIGYACGISPRTVRKHLEHAYEKLGAHDKVTAVLRFRSTPPA